MNTEKKSYFENLPPELRDAIWKLVLQQDRIFVPSQPFSLPIEAGSCREAYWAATKNCQYVPICKVDTTFKYARVDQQRDSLYLDLSHANTEWFSSIAAFTKIIIYTGRGQVLKLNYLLAWCRTLCRASESRPQPARIEEVCVVQESFDAETFKGIFDFDMRGKLFVASLDEIRTAGVLLQPGIHDEIRRLQADIHILLIDGRSNDIRPHEGDNFLHFENFKIKLPVRMEVVILTRGIMFWHLRSDWDTYAKFLAEIWTRYADCQTDRHMPKFQRAIQFKLNGPSFSY